MASQPMALASRPAGVPPTRTNGPTIVSPTSATHASTEAGPTIRLVREEHRVATANQFHSPSSFIVAGSRIARTMVTSMLRNGARSCHRRLHWRDVGLDRRPHACTRSVEQHALVDLAQAKCRAGLLRRPTFDVAQAD